MSEATKHETEQVRAERDALLRLLVANTEPSSHERWIAGSGPLWWRDTWCGFGRLSHKETDTIRSALAASVPTEDPTPDDSATP